MDSSRFIPEHGSDPWVYSFRRSIETVLGIIIAMLVSLMPKLIRTEEKG